VEEIFRHRQFLISSGEIEKRRKERARLELVDTIESTIKNYIDAEIDQEYIETLLDDLVRRKISPGAAAREIIDRSIKRVH
jgi:LAO/AO transport system kinase